MKYNIRMYEGSLPRKGIVPLNETGQMNGEEKIYEYMHKHPPRNLESANVRGWTHVASWYYTNDVLTKRAYWFIEYEDSDFMGSGTLHHVKKEVRFEYDHDTCVVTLHKDGQLTELLTKVNGILHGKQEIYWLDYDIPGDIISYVWCETYNYVNGLIEGPVIHIGRNGKVYKTCTYVNGKKHGEYRKYPIDIGGTIIRHYDNGKRCGNSVQYYPDNVTIRKTVKYDDPYKYRICTHYPDGFMYLTYDMDLTTTPFNCIVTWYEHDGSIDVEHCTFTKRVKDKALSYVYKGHTYASIIEHPEPEKERLVKSLIVNNYAVTH